MVRLCWLLRVSLCCFRLCLIWLSKCYCLFFVFSLVSVLMFWSVLIGVGFLSLFMGIKYVGWIIGMVVLFLCVVVMVYMVKFFVKCMDLDFSLIIFFDLVFIFFGCNVWIVISVFFMFEFFVVCVVLIVLFVDFFDLLFFGFLFVNGWKVFCVVILIFLNFMLLWLLSFMSIFGIFFCFSSKFCEMLVCVGIRCWYGCLVVFILLFDGFLKLIIFGFFIELVKIYFFFENWLILLLFFGLFMFFWWVNIDFCLELYIVNWL